ncbi:MAG: short-chain dehydrogenase [Rhodospirillales bacterium]|nr:short-chain dehydrogenase [Rhodospirillales bacterium]
MCTSTGSDSVLNIKLNSRRQSRSNDETKGAIDNRTLGLAAELGPRNIRVKAIRSGYTVTESTNDTGFFEGENGRHLLTLTPLGRLGQPADIAPAVVFLASDEAVWITGESIRVDGGAK